MSKGKYAARATLRREDAEVRSDIETYQQAVKRLTAENKELRAKLAADAAAHRQEARLLRSMLAEGVSPELNAMERRYKEERDRAERAVVEARRQREIKDKFWHAISKWLHDGTGATGLEVTEHLMALVNDAHLIPITAHVDQHVVKDAPDDQTAAARTKLIQTKNGWRSGAKSQATLAAVMAAARDGAS